jgi:hypothetical protein
MHSINILSTTPELLTFKVEMIPRSTEQQEGEEGGAAEKLPWTFSVHLNGKGLKPNWEGEASALEKASEEGSVTNPVQSSSSRVQVPQGTQCRFTFVPQPGTNIVSINMHPTPSNPALQEFIKDDKHPLRSRAKALRELPERYRILINCRM